MLNLNLPDTTKYLANMQIETPGNRKYQNKSFDTASATSPAAEPVEVDGGLVQVE